MNIDEVNEPVDVPHIAATRSHDLLNHGHATKAEEIPPIAITKKSLRSKKPTTIKNASGV